MRRILLHVCVVVTCCVHAQAQTQEAFLTPSTRSTSQIFGYTAAFDGQTAVIGATFEVVLGRENAGAAYVYQQVSGLWTQVAKITHSAPAANDFLSGSIAVDGDYIFVGVDGDDTAAGVDAGSTLVYERIGGVWTLVTTLAPAEPQAGQRFGAAIAIAGERAVISAPLTAHSGFDFPGAVYVFDRIGGVWQQSAMLTAPDAAEFDSLGTALALDDTRIVVAGPFVDAGGINDSGAVYVFEAIADGGWEAAPRLESPTPLADGEFGTDIAFSGGRLLIGEPNADSAGVDRSGAAYVFELNGAWQHTATLTHPEPGATDLFGISVSLDGNTALVGAYLDGTVIGAGGGSAYRYTFDGTQWTNPTELLPATQAQAGELFGWVVRMRGDRALITLPFDNLNQGAAYIFTGLGAGCEGDIDGDGQVNLSDLGVVLADFGLTGSSIEGDVDADGDVDLSDLGVVLASWGACD